ncbi:unnamed protein product [Staurois parvus]|uniref:Uncharacterized protein n=1 Tax=Staurois parvus TaxID=386267 RepID=A0ABN9FFU3_9NEOB|nr:unnamed protein product [Staurois parvus]
MSITGRDSEIFSGADRGGVCTQYRSLPCEHEQAALCCSAQHSNTKQLVYTVKIHTAYS